MKKLSLRLLLSALMAGYGASLLYSEDAEVKLNSNDGATKFVIQDSESQSVFGVDSDGNMLIKGTATIEGSSFSRWFYFDC